MDNFNSGKIKEMVYDVLQNPTRENFIDILDNGLGEQDNLDFKVQWIEAQKLAEILLGIANSGGGAIILGVKEYEDGITVAELIVKENVENPEYVTVTVNDDFVERDDFETTKLNEGDAVEFLYFMGGGAY